MRRLRRELIAGIIGLICLVASAQPVVARKQAGKPVQRTASNVVVCKALEMHTSAQAGVTVVLFHQRDKKDQPRFAALLKRADGSNIDIKIRNSDWQSVSVARLRMCFGRGLLFFPPGGVKLRDKDEFQVRFSGNKSSEAE